MRSPRARGRWIVLALGPGLACASDAGPVVSFDTPLAARPANESWTPTLVETFDASALDPARWFVWSGDLRHKNTLNSASPSLALVGDGALRIQADRTPADPAFAFATGYVDTRGRFAQTYGRISFRARVNYAPGVWYAMWGRSWTYLVPEIDIELLGNNTTQAWFVNHWDVPPVPADQRRGFTTVDGLDIRVTHTYTIVWTPELLEWQIDGKPFRRVTDAALVPHEPMFWVLNAWVGGWGGKPGSSTRFPAEMVVEEVRIERLSRWRTDAVVRAVDPRPKVSRDGAILVEVADLDPGAQVSVWEGETLLETLATPPFAYRPAALARGRHTLRFEAADAIDPTRRATTTLDVIVD